VDVIVAAPADATNRHAHTIVRAQNFPAQRECSRARRHRFSRGLQEFTPLDLHILPPYMKRAFAERMVHPAAAIRTFSRAAVMV